MDVFELQAKINLDSSNYESGLKEAEGGMEQLSASTIAKGQLMADAIEWVATKLIDMAKSAYSAIDDIGQLGDTIDKQSQKLGISNKAYQEWSFILQHCGSDISVLRTGMRKLNSAAEENSDAFNKLGISMEDVGSLSQEDLFSLVISRLQDMEAGTERNSIANDLLGRSYQELAPLLNMTSNETDEMRKSLEELGGIMSDEAVKQGATYEDTLLDLQTAFGGVKREILGGLVPALTEVMQSIIKFIQSNAGKKIVANVKDAVNKIFQALKKIDFEKLINGILNVIVKLTTFIANHFNGILTAVKAIAAAFIGWKIGKIVNTMVSSIKALIGGLKGATSAQQGLNVAMNANPIGLIITAITTLIAILPDLIGYFKEWLGIEGFEAYEERIDAITEAADRNRQAAEQMSEALKNGADSSSAEAAKMQGLVDMLNECVDSNGALKEGMEERANYALNELNNALGTEYTMEQLLNEGWENMRENILGVIEAQRYQSLMNTYWEQWEDAQANMGDTMKDLITSYQDLNAMTDVYNQTMEGAGKAAFGNLTEEMLKSELGLDDLETAYNDNSVAFSRMIEEQSVAEAARMAEADGNYTRAAEILDTYANTRQMTAEASSIAAKKTSEAEILALEQTLSKMGFTADEIKTLMSTITTDMDLSQKMSEIGANGAASFGSSFTSTWNSNQGSIFGSIDTLIGSIKHKLGIASPSKVFKSIGKFTSQGFEVGFDKEFKHTKKTFMDDMNSLVDYSNDLSFGEIGVSQSAKRQQSEVNSLKSAINGLQQSIAQLTSSDRMLNATIKIGDTTLAKTISRTLTNQQYREVAT